MKKELDDALVRDFPNLYADRHAPSSETCMCWGFCIGEGWEPIVRDLSAKLEKLLLEMPEPERAACRAMQVKEKLGGLRFYMTSETNAMTHCIQEAEDLAAKTCDVCGQPGTLRNKNMWLSTRCDEHKP